MSDNLPTVLETMQAAWNRPDDFGPIAGEGNESWVYQQYGPLAIAEELHRIADLMEASTDAKIEAAVEEALKKIL